MTGKSLLNIWQGFEYGSSIPNLGKTSLNPQLITIILEVHDLLQTYYTIDAITAGLTISLSLTHS